MMLELNEYGENANKTYKKGLRWQTSEYTGLNAQYIEMCISLNCEVSSGRVRLAIMKVHDMLQAYERLTGLKEAPKFIL